jgi:hypothetical protein
MRQLDYAAYREMVPCPDYATVANVPPCESPEMSIADAKARVRAANLTRLTNLLHEGLATASPEWFFDRLPAAALTSAKTDSDGRFSLDIGRHREVILVARAERQAGAIPERYSWIVPARADAETPVMLSNDNQIEGLKSLVTLFGDAIAPATPPAQSRADAATATMSAKTDAVYLDRRRAAGFRGAPCTRGGYNATEESTEAEAAAKGFVLFYQCPER